MTYSALIDMHPNMTLAQLDAWCERHACAILISHTTPCDGPPILRLSVILNDAPSENLPALLRRQGY